MFKNRLIPSPGRKVCGISRMALLGFAWLAFAALGFGQSKFVDIHGQLSVKGNKIVDKNSDPITLRGMSLYCWAAQGWQFFNASAINHLAQDWKCTVIRIAIRPQDYRRNPTVEINKVKTVMDACIANGIYAIVDWHSMQGAQNDTTSSQAFFSTLAAAYGKTPNIMYEPWNEPVRETWPVIKAYHEAIIAKIRPLDPDNIIICGNRNWDQQCAEASRDPITSSKNIAYSIHFYAGTHRQSLRDNGAEALKNGVALFATEYGTSTASGGGAYDPAETKLWWSWLDANHIGCANWSVAALGETSAAFKPGASATGPWTDDMLKPSGLLVRDYIMSKYPAVQAAAPAPAARPAKEAYLRIAGEVEANLQKEILDKWLPVAVDEQGGGFFENYNLDWTRGRGNNKSIVYQSRLTWTAAQAAGRFPAKAGMYLAMTRRGAACLADKLWDKTGGGFYWQVGADGQPASTTKQMYGHAFGIYALAASYQATRDQATLDLAKKAFQWLEEHAHDSVNKGYFENVGPDGKPLTTGGNAVGAGAGQKSMNTSIHILEALTGLYQVWPDPLLKTRVQEMLEICRDKIYSEPGYLFQFLSADWKPTASADSFGHDVEAGFLMVEAAEALGQDDPQAWTAARRLVDHALQYGWDAQRGGLYDSGTLAAQGAVASAGLRTEKIWWVEAENLNALLLQHEHVGKETPKYWDAFLKQWDWITKYQVDHKNGGWWATVQADGTPASRVKADMWTECYHQGRAMLNVSARLRKLAAEN